MKYFALVIMLLSGAASAQTPPHQYHWKDTSLGWVRRLMDGHQWTQFMISNTYSPLALPMMSSDAAFRDRAPAYTLYQGQTVVAKGNDLAALKAQAEDLAKQQ